MPWINLIQEQTLLERANARKARMFLFAFAGAFGVSVTAVGFLTFQLDTLNGEVSRLNAKTQRVAPLIRQVDDSKNELAVMGPKLTTLEDAQKTSARWSRILEHLTRQTPPQTWLTTMRCTVTDPTKPINVTLAGLSFRQELVGEFILRLQGCTDLENVALKFTQEKMISTTRNIEFEVSADIAGTAEAKPKDEAKDESKEESK